MEKVTFYESIIKVLSVISSIPFLIEILILTFSLLIIMIFFYFRKSKKGKITAIIIYIVSLILLPISKFSFFIEMFDSIIENYIEVLYFPSWYMYIIILLYTDIVVLINFIKNTKKEKTEWYNIFNILYFCVIQFLFYIAITIITQNNINIFEKTQLYSNTKLISVIQVCSYLFWIRIGIKFVIFIVNLLNKIELSKSKQDKISKNQIDNNVINKSTSNINNNNLTNETIIQHINEKNTENYESILESNIKDIHNSSNESLNINPNQSNSLFNKNYNNQEYLEKQQPVIFDKPNNIDLSSNITFNSNLKPLHEEINAIPKIQEDKHFSSNYNYKTANSFEQSKTENLIIDNNESDKFFDDFYE